MPGLRTMCGVRPLSAPLGHMPAACYFVGGPADGDMGLTHDSEVLGLILPIGNLDAWDGEHTAVNVYIRAPQKRVVRGKTVHVYHHEGVMGRDFPEVADVW